MSHSQYQLRQRKHGGSATRTWHVDLSGIGFSTLDDVMAWTSTHEHTQAGWGGVTLPSEGGAEIICYLHALTSIIPLKTP